MERLFYYPERAATPPPSGVDGAWFESADGTRLFGWWIPAEGWSGAATPAPTIIHVHGNAGNILSHVWFSDHLPPAGFNVFIFDYRGYGQSEGRARSRDALIADTVAAIDVVLKRPDVDPNRVGLYGHSLGGAIALNAIVERPRIQAAVLESPFASWREVAANAIGGDPPNVFGRLLAGILISDRARADAAIRHIDRPILILHGTGDTIVPLSHARRLAEIGGERVELIILQGGEHNSLKDTHPETAAAMVEFFRRQLQPGPSS